MENKTENLVSAKFALWGPTGSGKDWVIRSFARSLEQYNNEKSQRYDKDFEHIVYNSDGVTPEKIHAPEVNLNATRTGQAEDTVWIYERRGRQKTPVHIVSAHTHEILITNSAGVHSQDLDNYAVNFTFENANCLLVLLDPTLVKNGIVSMEGYQTMVNNLLSQLGKPSNGDKRFIAACVTKNDQLKTKRPAAREEMILNFGAGMDEVFRVHTKSSGVELEVFSISSYGFLKDGKTPNYNDELSNLKDKDSWTPINVEQPFFWLFEKVERNRVGRFSKELGKFLYADQRQSNYRGYPRGKW